MSIKIVLIGAGAVGTSFVYSAINQGLAAEYVLIDAFPNAALGNALDLADVASTISSPFCSVKSGTYNELKNADIVVITAGRPQKKIIDPKTNLERLETRLEMISGNAVIMADIANQVKKSGFKGITIIASNPVDVLTRVYQEVTQFDEAKVIGSGTTLDSSRLRRLIGEKLNINAQSINAYIIGEHGDSSVAVWSNATVSNVPIKDFKISDKELTAIHKDAVNMAYKIIELKRATFYGIGCALARIVKAIINNENQMLIVGAKLHGQYGAKDVYIGVPCIINKNGIGKIIEWKLNASEKSSFLASVKALQNNFLEAKKAIKK